jgi:hypothetical protein
MKTAKTIQLASQGVILLSACSFLSVSLMAFANPQSVMDLVQVQLTNTDAFSSIRGVYGGVGLALSISLFYLMLRDVPKGLALLSLLWGFYALSRIITLFTEGPLGAFGTQWLTIEASLFLATVTLLLLNRKPVPVAAVH